jgi:hypothetical protein
VNLAHLHLIMNHVPTVGAVVALALLLLAVVRRSEHLRRAGLEVLFIIAVLTLPVFVSGLAAYHEMREQPEISFDTVMRHQDAALIAFTLMEAAGFAAWIALWQARRRGHAGRGVVPATTSAPPMLQRLSKAILNDSCRTRSRRLRCTARGCGRPPRQCTSWVCHFHLACSSP